MAAGFTLRERRVAYDNLSVGNPAGLERTCAGGVQPAQTYGGIDNLTVGDTSRDPDNLVPGETANPANENVGVGG